MTEQEIDVYIDTAMQLAKTTEGDDPGDWLAVIDDLPGVWGAADNKSKALHELRRSVQDWVYLTLAAKEDLPVLATA